MQMHVAVLFVVMLINTAALSANITDVPGVVDGDTVAIGATKVP